MIGPAPEAFGDMRVLRSEPTSIASLRDALRGVEPDALLVSPRLLRRLIRRRHPHTGPALHVPHRDVLALRESEALEVAGREELGLEGPPDPERVLILLREPDRRDLRRRAPADLLLDCWRGLFHARVHVALEREVAAGRLTPAAVRERVGRLGPVEFDEARAVLRRDERLLPPVDEVSTYVEFAAVYLELRHFDPRELAWTFPAIEDLDRVDALLAEEVDAPSLLVSTRPPGAAEPAAPADEVRPDLLEAEGEAEEPPGPPPDAADAAEPFSERRTRHLLGRASRAEELGNHVRAALLRSHAARSTSRARAGQARAAAVDALDALADRLQRALEFDDAERARWRRALRALLPGAARGVWPAEARLLYDLQAVCVDHEREYYTLDLIEWMLALGRRSIKRLLPNQREVAECRHLRRATKRLGRARLADDDRQRLATLLHRAVDRVEDRLRERFRPLIRRALERADLEPKNLPERVAFDKVVEELLDLVVGRGYLTAGDLRDAISRNPLKLPDLRASDLLRGDRLLRADHRVAISLAGVYRRAEVYLRGLQKASSVAFGTPLGRTITLFLVLPFGGAFVTLEGLQHLVEPVLSFLAGHAESPGRGASAELLAVSTLGVGRLAAAHAPAGHGAASHHAVHVHLVSPYSVLALGLVILALIHLEAARRLARRLLAGLGTVLRWLVLDLPGWIATRPLLRAVLFSRPVALLWHWLVAPMAVALLLCLAMRLGEYDRDSLLIAGSAMYLLAVVLINSRLGRDLEESLVDQAQRGWARITADLLPSLYRAVMAFFDRALEGLDRLIYTVDEWLRFRSGESRLTLAVKAVAGLAWFAITYVVRFCMNLLVEPQVNPIKHFPVVTVAHKVMLPFMLALPPLLMGPPLGLSAVRANGVAFVLQMLLPGVFGFLVWELKENWRLYAANRPPTLRPVVVGHHGETLARLLRPGFHSGTLPKTFARLRRGARRPPGSGRARTLHKQREALLHVEHAVAHFLDRELLALLRESAAMRGQAVAIASIELSTNRIRARLVLEGRPGEPWGLSFEEQAGWLLAGSTGPGWVRDLPDDARRTLGLALAGLYKLAGVDLVREQVREALRPPEAEYEVVPRGLLAWPPDRPGSPVLIELHDPARPARSACPADVVSFDPARNPFPRVGIAWDQWVELWRREESGQGLPPTPGPGPVLPPEGRPEVSRSR